jgi:hypothetical protein
MPDIIIKAEALGKKYTIGHQGETFLQGDTLFSALPSGPSGLS